MIPLFHLAAAAGLQLSPQPEEPAMPMQTTVAFRVTSDDHGDGPLLRRRLMRQLGNRLLEDGYRAVPTNGPASVRVSVHLGFDGATIDVRGTFHVVERVTDAEPEMMLLELQQLTTALVDEVQPIATDEHPAVVVELLGRSDDPELRERLQVGLLERGFALTRRPSKGDVRLCVAAAGMSHELSVVAGEESCAAARPGRPTSEGSTATQMDRELLFDASASRLADWQVHALQLRAPAHEPEVAEREAAAKGDGAATRSENASDRRASSVGLSASAGVLGRVGGTDPVFAIELRGGRQSGLGGGLGLTVVPSQVDSLRVVESIPTAVFDWRIGFAERGLVTLGASAGPHIHSYSYGGPRGTRVGANVGASVRLSYLARRGAMVFGGVRGGRSGGRWIHVDGGRTRWRRSPMFLGAELGLGWDIRLGARP